MHSIRNIFMTALLFTVSVLQASNASSQKAYPVDVNIFIAKVPIPQSSQVCYAACGKTTDPATGFVTIQDKGPGFKALQDQLDNYMKAAMNSVGLQAAQMQGGQTGGRPSANEIELIKLVGQAQTACGQINRLSMEFSGKIAALDNSPINNVKIGANCPDVQQGGYAGPTCACLIARGTAYETKRVAARDDYVSQVNNLMQEYIAKFHVQVAIVDDAVAKAKYGDAITNPAFKQQVVSIQRQAMAAVTVIASIAGGCWEDAAKQYAYQVNTQNGSAVGCAGKK